MYLNVPLDPYFRYDTIPIHVSVTLVQLTLVSMVNGQHPDICLISWKDTESKNRYLSLGEPKYPNNRPKCSIIHILLMMIDELSIIYNTDTNDSSGSNDDYHNPARGTIRQPSTKV